MIDKHHIHPRFMDNKKGDGKIYDLEKGEHIKLHLIIPSIVWKYIEENKKKKCIDEVIKFSEKYIERMDIIKNIVTNQTELIPETKPISDEPQDCKICVLCGYENDIEDIFCNSCGNTIYESTITEREEDMI